MNHWVGKWWINKDTKFYVHAIVHDEVCWTYNDFKVTDYVGRIKVSSFKEYIRAGLFELVYKLPKNYKGNKREEHI